MNDYPDDCLNSLDFLGFDPNMSTEEYLKRVVHQRNVLAQEIKNFLVKTGGIVEDCAPNGPELILALQMPGDYFANMGYLDEDT